MAENSLSQLAPAINSPSSLITATFGNQPAILSTEVAQRFKKRHQHILRDIDRIIAICPKSFTATNFGLSNYQDSTGRTVPAFLLTRDAFSLLVMGFTGRAAMLWKIKYIEAFNALEKAALENCAELAREAGYMQGRDEAMSLPMLEAERKKGYLAGLKEGRKYRARMDGLQMLKKIFAYRQKGLSCREIGKIVGISKSAVAARMASARRQGFWPQLVAVQGNLPGVE